MVMEAIQLQMVPDIDKTKTKNAVEAALETYRIYLLSEPVEKLPKVTQTFSLEMPNYSKSFHSSTEEAAIYNIDHERARQKHIKQIQTAVNRLGYKERAVIIKKYMAHEDMLDYQVYMDLKMSEADYYRVKSKALCRLAFVLHLEVYKEEGEL